MPDDLDACPRIPGQVSSNASETGCPPAGGASAGAGEPIVTYAGHHLFADGGSRIYIRLGRPVPVTRKREGNRVAFRMAGATVPAANNRKALPMQHFSSPIMVAHVEPEAGAATLIVELRADVDPQHRVLSHADGSATLIVDFPPPR